MSARRPFSAPQEPGGRSARQRFDLDHAGREATRLRLRVRAADGTQRWIECPSLASAEAARYAAVRGWQLLAIEPATPSRPTAGPARPSASDVAAQGSNMPLRGRGFPLMLFSQELLSLLEAGLSLPEALQTLLAKERVSTAHRVLQGLMQGLQQGRSLSEVLAAQPQIFPEIYVATVRAAERTGDLAPALARYVAYQGQLENLRRKLVSAALYPLLLLGVGGVVTLFLLGYVVPRFSLAYESAGRELPWLSAVLLAVGRFIAEQWPALLGALGLVVATLVWALRQPALRERLLAQVLSLPGLAPRAAEFRRARFYRALSLLLASGIALPRAMGMATGLLGAQERLALGQAKRSVEQGQPLSAALMSTGLATVVADSLIRVGERSGALAAMLERTARFHDEDMARWVDWSGRLLEPALMALIGLVIGGVVVLMYLPIFDLAGAVR